MADDSFSESDIDGWSMSGSEGYESTKPAQAPLPEAGGEGEEEEMMFSMVTEDAGEQTMAIRPWLGAIVAPSDYNPSDPPRQPPGGLSAEWVYGFRGHDVRNNLIILPSGELMYPMAAVVILYDAGSHTQRHYFGHTDDIISVAAHPGGTVAASGEVGNYSPIRVWSTETLETFHVLDGHRKGVNALDFLADERLLASVSADDQRTVHVWDWEAGGAPVASSGHNHRVYALKANPADGSQFVTTGKNSVSFWSVDAAAGTVSMKKGIFGKKGKLQPIVSVAFTPKGTAVTGGKLGGLYLWVGGTVKDKRRAHRAPVYMLMSNSEGVISGGGDGLLKFWDFRFNNTKTIDIHTLSPLPSVRTAVRAAWWDAPSGRVVVGTKASEVFEFGADTDGSDANLLIQGHFNKELWGLAMHPSNPDVFATAGEDKTVRVWDGGAHRQTNCAVVTDEARCIDYSPDGTLLAIGLKDGSFVLMNADGLDLVANAKDRREWIEEVKFSPSGSMLAVGSHDTKIDVYTVPHLERVATCSGHSSTILHIDWSADESVLQTVSQAYEILWFDPQSGQQLTNATGLKDTEWATFTCKFGFPVQGIWPSRAHDKSDINTVDRSHSGDALVTGDDWGMVKVFGCPCVNEGDRYNEGAPFADFGGHSAHVTKTRFNADDSRVVSTGGGEHSIFQWAYTS